jgi:hypothetical protein
MCVTNNLDRSFYFIDKVKCEGKMNGSRLKNYLLFLMNDRVENANLYN